MREAAQYLIMLLALLTIQRSATAAEPSSPEPVMARVESQQRIFAVTPGVTVAADPDVLPLGTRIYIDGIGERVVQDTGGAIKGRKIDLAMESHQEAVAWGVQHKGVWICSN